MSFLSFSQNELPPQPPPPPPGSIKRLPPSPSKIAAIEKLLEATGGAKMGTAVFENMMNGYKAAGMSIDADIVKEAVKEVNMNELIEGMIPIYDRFYSEEEINQLTAFYNSPIGKKTIEVSPALIQQSMMVGQQWGAKIWEKIQKSTKGKEESKSNQ